MTPIKALCSKPGSVHTHSMNATSVIMGKTYTTKPDNLSATVSFSIVSFSIRDLVSNGDDIDAYATRERFNHVPIEIVQNSLTSYSNRFNFVESLEIELQDNVVYKTNGKDVDCLFTAAKVQQYLAFFKEGGLDLLTAKSRE